MANKKPKRVEKIKEHYIIFVNGTEKKITGENGKYWFCEDGTQHRKLSPNIREVVMRREEVEKPVEEESEEKTAEELDEGFDQIPDVSDLVEEGE